MFGKIGLNNQTLGAFQLRWLQVLCFRSAFADADGTIDTARLSDPTPKTAAMAFAFVLGIGHSVH